jgi:ribonuclease BN (tRNA processing enzyme)
MRPNKYRNVSGILVDNENSALILDCGEGTFDQL